MLEKQNKTEVKLVRSDNGPGFLLHDFYASKGIIHQTGYVETPQQNGRVEKKHQHILNTGRDPLFHSKLPKQYWSYAILHATYIMNRIPSPILENKSPYFITKGVLPKLNDLEVFGCLCYTSTLQSHRTKLELLSWDIRQGLRVLSFLI